MRSSGPYRLVDLRRIRHADEIDHGDIVVRQLGTPQVTHDRHVTRDENLQL